MGYILIFCQAEKQTICFCLSLKLKYTFYFAFCVISTTRGVDNKIQY